MKDLKYKAKLDIEDVKKAKAELLKMFKDIGIKSSDSFSAKPMTEYQAGLLKIRQDALDFAKQKAEEAKADKAASLATQKALQDEIRLRKEAAAVPRKVDFGNSSAEVASSLASNSTGGVVNPAFTQYLKQVKADFDAGKISAAQYTAELERYSTVLVEGVNSTKNATKATKDLTLSKKELETIAAQEKLNAQQNAAALKNSVREMNAAKGSIEQRRAALIRLNTVYDNLNAAERNSASGQRLKGIVGSLTDQVKTLEAETGRAQRNVGNYGGALTKAWSGLKTIANILPGVGLAGLLAFAVEPIMKYISSLGLFKDKIDQILETRKELSNANLKGAQDAQTEIVQLKVLYDTAKNVELSSEQRYKAAKKLQEQYPDTFKNYSIEQIELGKVDAAYLRLSSAILATARARASEQKIAENSARALGNEQVITDERTKIEKLNEQLLKVKATYNELAKKGFKDIGSTGVSSDEVVLNTKIAGLQNKIADSQKIINNNLTDTNLLNDRNLKLTENIVAQQKKGADIVGSTKTNTTKVATANLEAQRTLQSEIDALTKKAQFKSASDDEQELAAIDAKYDKLREKAIAFNNDVIKFNADAKNKIKKQQVDIGGLGVARTNEIDASKDKFAASTLKVQLTEQKALYDEYEAYKLKVGVENAKKLSGDKIDTEKTYLQYLQGLEEQLTNDPKAKVGDEAKKEQHLKVLRQSIAEQTALKEKQQRDDFISAFEAAKTFTQKILEVNETFEKNKLALGANASEEEIKNLEKTRDKAISTLATSELTNSDIWANLFGNLDELTSKELDTLIKEVEKQFNSLSGSFDPIDLDALRKKLQEAKAVLIADNPFAAIGQAIKALNEDSVDGVKKTGKQIKADWVNLGKSTEAAFDFVNDAVQSADFLKEAIGEVGATAITSLLTIATVSIAVKTAIKTAEKASVILAIISAALVVVQAVANVLKGIFAANDKRIEKSIQSQKHEVELLTQAYADLERAVTSAIGENIYRQQQLQIENIKKKQAEIQKMRDAEASKKKSDQSKIDEYNQQIKEAGQKIVDINNQIAESLIQTNFKDLSQSFADALTSAFQEASDAGEAFDKVFNQTIANAIKNSLKLKLLEPVIAEFTNALSTYAQNNNNSILGFDFETYRKKIKDAADLYSKGIAASGDFFQVDVEAKVTLTAFETDAFSILFKSAEETGKSIEEILKNSILEGLKAEIFTDALKPLQAKIAALYKDGRIPTKEELSAITAEYTAFIDGAKAKLKGIEDATGLVFGDAMSSQIEAINSELDSMASKITDIFANSENKFQDFETMFNNMVKDSLLKSLQASTLQGKLADFMKHFAALDKVEDGKKQEQIALLRAQYNEIIKEGKDEYERLQGVFGVDYGSSASKPSAAIGEGVQRITEDTANAIAGPIIGTFEQATKIANLMGKHYAIATQALDMAVKTEANTRRGANAGEDALPLLNEIARNTRPKSNGSLSDSYSKLI